MDFGSSFKPAVVSTLPAAGTAGRVLCLSTDNSLYYDNGVEWVNVSAYLAINTQSGTTYSPVASDKGKEIRATNAAAKTITIDPTGTLGTDFICSIANLGAGALTISPGSGVTLRNNSGTVAQYKSAVVRAIGTDEYLVTPDSASGSGFAAPFALTDAATILIDGSLSQDFYVASAVSRILGAPGDIATEMKTIAVRWKNTGGSPITMSPATGSAGAFRYAAGVTAIPATAAGDNGYIIAKWHDVDSRWDIVGYSGEAAGYTLQSGETTVDFGAFPGKSDASVVVTGQAGILATSNLSAWITAKATADHSADEHWVETIDVMAGNISAGVGFTIYAKNTNQINEPLRPVKGSNNSTLAGGLVTPGLIQIPTAGGRGTQLYGLFTVKWQWS